MRSLMSLGLVGLALLLASPPSHAAADNPLAGTWKLVLFPGGEIDFMIVEVPKEGDAKVLSSPPFVSNPSITSVEEKDGTVTLKAKIGNQESTFVGLPAEGKPGTVLGAIDFQGNTYPAQLVNTEDKQVGQGKPSPIMQGLSATRQETDLKARAAAVQKVIDANAHDPNVALAYNLLLADAKGAGMTPEQVEKAVAAWIAAAKPYGPAWGAEVRNRALKVLVSQPEYAKLALGLAKEADAALPADAPLATQAAVVGYLARSAEAAGDDLVAKQAAERSAKLEGQLDEEYKKKVPPFEPKPFAGRDDKDSNTVVMMELFTGAQCPPCVAADVAFDALLETYKETDLIGLQYHLHIPGPDPLTNPTTEARQSYYEDVIRGTPTTIFNGKSEAGGGGGMANAEAKYGQYREIIEKRLEGKARASIDLKATRDGDTITINATAKADAGLEDTKPVLRLVLAEPTVRYTGGNGLRFHHHVVRAMPGGPDGKALADGAATAEQTVKLADLRAAQEEYLSEYAKTRAFPNALPPMDLSRLSVVAFVQDDNDKSVWTAVVVPVNAPDAKPAD